MNLPGIIAISSFIGVMLFIMTEKIHLTAAAFFGALILVFTHVMSLQEAVDYISRSHGTVALFFGVMVLVRVFEPTNFFQYVATKMVLIAKGSGKLLVLGIIGITTPICAVFPNATMVMLLAPLIPPIAQEIGLDFVPLLILIVFVANSSGLLTLVGDPATFIVGDSINLSFTDYISRLSLGGAIAVTTVLVLSPLLFSKIWNTQFTNLDQLPRPKINHPKLLILVGLIMIFVLIFFIIGDYLPLPVSPATVALSGAALALILAHQSKIDTVNSIFKDLDWSTLIFFMSIFVLVGGLEKTGVTSYLSNLLALVIGKNIALGSLILLFSVGILSSVVPNIPLVVAMVPLLKEYIVNIGMASSDVLNPDFSGNFPPEVLPLFYAMMFGATLGGNGTLVGASSNIVAAGISEQHGRTISFKTFLKYGLPVMGIQLIVSALYIVIFFLR